MSDGFDAREVHADPAPAGSPASDRPATPRSEAPDREAARPPEAAEEPRRGVAASLRELPVLILIALVLALLIKTFLVQAFFIPSGSMEPTLQIGDRVLVSKISYDLHSIHIGDIVVFSDPHATAKHRNPFQAFAHWLTDGLGFTTSPTEDFIKRVIGLPGDTVQVRPGGTVLVNGRLLAPEPYVNPATVHSPSDTAGTWHVPPGHLFVLGDNRGDSCDSRCTLGFIPIKDVIGRAFVIIWPFSQARWLSTPAYRSGA